MFENREGLYNEDDYNHHSRFEVKDKIEMDIEYAAYPRGSDIMYDENDYERDNTSADYVCGLICEKVSWGAIATIL